MPNATTPPASAAVTVEVRRTFAASRQRVFDAWSSAEALTRWHAPDDAVVEDANVDFRVGGRYDVAMRGNDGQLHHVGGVYREIDPPARLVLTWRWAGKVESGDSLVTVQFIDRGVETEVILTHEGLATEASRQGHRHGWVGCFHKLAATV